MPALMIATTSANANGLRVGDVNNITKGAATYYHEPFRSVLEEATAFLRYFQQMLDEVESILQKQLHHLGQRPGDEKSDFYLRRHKPHYFLMRYSPDVFFVSLLRRSPHWR